MDKINLTIRKQKNIALIAHDAKKHDLIDWCKDNADVLNRHFLIGTGTTARMISMETDLPVKGYNSGPLGGDQQIGARIVEGKVDMVISLINAVYLLQQDYFLNLSDFTIQVI